MKTKLPLVLREIEISCEKKNDNLLVCVFCLSLGILIRLGLDWTALSSFDSPDKTSCCTRNTQQEYNEGGVSFKIENDSTKEGQLLSSKTNCITFSSCSAFFQEKRLVISRDTKRHFQLLIF